MFIVFLASLALTDAASSQTASAPTASLTGDEASSTPLSSEYRSTLNALALSVGLSDGIFGHAIVVGLGVQGQGVRTYADRRWLLAWSGRLELVSGVAAYQHPFRALLGARLDAATDGAYRILSSSDWSPAVVAGLDLNVSTIAQIGATLDGTQINNQDGLAGVMSGLSLRAGAGVSFLRARHSLLISVSLLGRGETPQSNTPARAYGGGALRVRYDLACTLTALGELTLAVTPTTTNVPLGITEQSNRWTLSGSVVKRFGAHLFLGLGAALSRVQTTSAYAGANTYAASSPITAQFWLTGGYAR
jgi:hypothetical protein